MAVKSRSTSYETVIGLEIHAELTTKSKMFCSCAVVDTTEALPNSSVCPVCSGVPGTLPVTNKHAVELGLRVALALGCEINLTSIFARKNYFYPDLPKGYQISQYEQPLARNGVLTIDHRDIRIRRVHLEEDTGKLTHIDQNGESISLINLNRAGIPLLEIVTEPDIRSADEARLFATRLRDILRYLKVNSGNLQKGVLRIEPNVSVRSAGSDGFGTRTEIKNLNSFRALERGIDYEVQRQTRLIESGEDIIQQTMGWDENKEETFPQRTKETEHDYRYFPEPDLPPLVLEQDWIDQIRGSLPELPAEKQHRFVDEYRIKPEDAEVLIQDPNIADYFETVLEIDEPDLSPQLVANWLTGELFGLMNAQGKSIDDVKISPENFSELLGLLKTGLINQSTAKSVLEEMFTSGKPAKSIVKEKGLEQVSDKDQITSLIEDIVEGNPDELQTYLEGKETLFGWFVGQVMRATGGKADPRVVREELSKYLDDKKSSSE